MKTFIVAAICFICIKQVNGQESVDLKKVPDATIGVQVPKSNALLLKESQPAQHNKEVDLSEQYNHPTSLNNVPATFRTVNTNSTQPNLLQTAPEVNGTTHQINLGSGSGANARSTTYYDNEGKIKGTNTTISFGK